jgi:muramidase (phage lysozyme)
MLQQLTKEASVLLGAIRGSESSTDKTGYNMRYSPKGGAVFTDFSKHPRIYEVVPWRNDGKKSDASGAYQFLSSTFNPLAERYNIPDFSPASQDKAAWILAQDVYRKTTGRDLQQALERGEYMETAKVLSGTWTSLPSGSEQNKATNSFMTRVNKLLKGESSVSMATPVSGETSKEIDCGLSVYCYGAKLRNAAENTLNRALGREEKPFTENSEYGQLVESELGFFESTGIRIAIGVTGALLLTIGLVKLKV